MSFSSLNALMLLLVADPDPDLTPRDLDKGDCVKNKKASKTVRLRKAENLKYLQIDCECYVIKLRPQKAQIHANDSWKTPLTTI